MKEEPLLHGGAYSSFLAYLEALRKRRPDWYSGKPPAAKKVDEVPDFQMRAAHDDWDAVEPLEENK